MLQLVEHLEPELGALGLLDPQAEHFLAAVGASIITEPWASEACNAIAAYSIATILGTVRLRMIGHKSFH